VRIEIAGVIVISEGRRGKDRAQGTRREVNMPTEIGRAEVQQLVAAGAQLVDVMPAKAYEEEHLPGALNIPLKDLDRASTGQLDRDRPVIVYCYDTQ
jgi:rhodanese-related sulfurtransferase